MAFLAAPADTLSGRRLPFAGSMAWALAGVMAAAVAGAMSYAIDPQRLISHPVSKAAPEALSFESRFQSAALIDPQPTPTAPPLAVRASSPELDTKLQQARDLLAQKLQSPDWRTALVGDSRPPTVTAVPLPRSRPLEASLEPAPGAPALAPAPAAESDNRTVLQKLADFAPARAALASLTPTDGLFSTGPDLTALGYDSLTAVYDITARAVYLPNGAKLEAHSGMGSLMDDPAHVNERMVGATPPATYDLKPRERLFHGIQALRMIPLSDGDTLGRTGLLTHSYMLGPNGDSNGCVSIRNYDKFLAAYKNGEIRRLVVVPSLSDAATAARHTSEPS
jgi:hypothetical protein